MLAGDLHLVHQEDQCYSEINTSLLDYLLFTSLQHDSTTSSHHCKLMASNVLTKGG